MYKKLDLTYLYFFAYDLAALQCFKTF